MNLFEKALRAYYGAPDDQPSLAMLESMTEKYAMGGGMQPAIDVVVADTRKRIAYLIRAELVCCDIYEKVTTPFNSVEDKDREGYKAAQAEYRRLVAVAVGRNEWHQICYYGEWSARLAETGDLPDHVFYGPSDEHPTSGTRSDRPRKTPDPRND